MHQEKRVTRSVATVVMKGQYATADVMKSQYATADVMKGQCVTADVMKKKHVARIEDRNSHAEAEARASQGRDLNPARDERTSGSHLGSTHEASKQRETQKQTKRGQASMLVPAFVKVKSVRSKV